MYVETTDSIYEAIFQHVQFEITGECNLKCQHCRAWREPKVELPVQTILEVLSFATKSASTPFFVTLSGGEPFLRKDLSDIVRLISDFPVTEAIITTNGWWGSKELLKSLNTRGRFPVTIQVSLDSIDSSDHDRFRGRKGAFERAVSTLRLARECGLETSIRMSVRPDKINMMSQMAEFAISLKAARIGFGPIAPTGRAKNSIYLMSFEEKKLFHYGLADLKTLYKDRIEVTTEDPLKFALCRNDIWDSGVLDPQEDGVFDGCTAGISTFNVGSDGVVTPCAVLPVKIITVNGKKADQIEDEYCRSEVVRSLFERKFHGECGKCALRRVCGGCRAVPYGLNGDYLGSDTSCWRHGISS